MTITVRPIQASDHAAWLVLWQDYLSFYNSQLSEAQTALTWQRLLDSTHAIQGLVAVQNSAVIGFTHFLFHPATWSPQEYCYLEDLFVSTTARGSGAGRLLIGAVKQVAQDRGATKVYWLTQTQNATARRVYDAVAKDTGFMHYQITL
jgi:GNAT superfamily N-acetyltransferase